jgi:hypothetical protein
MKKILLSAALLLCIASFGQISEYNKTTKFKQNFGDWSKNNASEMFMTEQNPVGYKNSYDELKRVLDFYGLDITESFKNNSLLSSGTSIQDFTKMSNDIYLEIADVNMMWETKSGNRIFFICSKDSNGVLIKPKM